MQHLPRGVEPHVARQLLDALRVVLDHSVGSPPTRVGTPMASAAKRPSPNSLFVVLFYKCRSRLHDLSTRFTFSNATLPTRRLRGSLLGCGRSFAPALFGHRIHLLFPFGYLRQRVRSLSTKSLITSCLRRGAPAAARGAHEHRNGRDRPVLLGAGHARAGNRHHHEPPLGTACQPLPVRHCPQPQPIKRGSGAVQPRGSSGRRDGDVPFRSTIQ
jgi:hypothetical protein